MNSYRVDLRLYRDFDAGELPFRPDPSSLNKSCMRIVIPSEVVNTYRMMEGRHSVIIDMTETDFEKFEEWTLDTADIKIIGITLLNKAQ